MAARVGISVSVYVTSEGNVIHLTSDTPAMEPGSSVRIGEPASGEWFRLVEPGGAEIAVALFSKEPLEIAPENRVQSMTEFMESIELGLSSGGEPVLMSVMPLTVAAK